MLLNVVGQAPSRDSDPERPLDARRNRERLEYLLDEPFANCHVSNLLNTWPGAARGKGDRFPLHRARRAARVIDLVEAPVVVLGLRVAEAFGLRGELFWTGEVRGRPAIVVPHPSGVSLWWNDPAAVEAGRKVILEWKKSIPERWRRTS